MKKIIVTGFSLIFLICGCTNSNTNQQKVVINQPNDNSVNGYRLENSYDDNVISGADVTIGGNQTTITTVSYCGNKNTKKFHKTSCKFSINTKEENKVNFNSKEDFLNNGYSPCKICKP